MSDQKKNWNIELLQNIISRDSATLLSYPDNLGCKSNPKFMCGDCKTETVDYKQFGNMYKYGCICKKCANIRAFKKREQTLLELYNVSNPNDIPGNAEKKKETRENNKGEDDIKENARHMVNHRWNKEEEKSKQIVEKGSQICKTCNESLSLDKYIILKNKKQREYTSYSKICRKCFNIRRNEKRDKINQSISLNKYLNELLKEAKRRSEKKQFEFSLDLDYVIDIYNQQNKNCYYTGRELKVNTSKKEHEGKRVCPDKLSIDRIDSSKGYIKGNVVLCTWAANNMKQDQSTDEFKNIIREIYNYYCQT
jgi:hypothetical protein